MNEQELIQYLANIIYVAHSDAVLSPSEESALEKIREGINAKKSEYNKAKKLISDPSFKTTPIGRYSYQLRNFEDMLFLAIADKELTDSEKTQITAFAKQIGLTQQQIDIIKSEAMKRLEGTSDRFACPNCKQAIPASSKFCPKCGTPLDQANHVNGTKLDFDYPRQGISIEFAESSSANFHTALMTAKQAPNFQECIRGTKKWYLATWPNHNIPDAMKLVSNLKGLKNKKAYFSGNLMSWDEVFNFAWCYQNRQKAYRPAMYCFGIEDKDLNLWGCQQLYMDWTDWSNWFSYGSFPRKDIFIFDKKRIMHELNKRLYKARFCPYIRLDLIKTVLELLPEKIHIGDGNWDYRERYEESPDTIKVVQKICEGGIVYKKEFPTDGVKPVGYKIAKEILEKAFKICGITDVTAKQLTNS